jgi:hypothetical protein
MAGKEQTSTIASNFQMLPLRPPLKVACCAAGME